MLVFSAIKLRGFMALILAFAKQTALVALLIARFLIFSYILTQLDQSKILLSRIIPTTFSQ